VIDDLAGFPVAAPPLGGPVWFDQSWLDLTFLHWPVRPDNVAHLYPPGTRPDIFDDMTYVGLVPFRMGYTKVGTAPPLPYFGAFAETNVRLYSVDNPRRHGVLFRSLESARLAVVPAIRLTIGVPYTWARMRITRSSHTREAGRTWWVPNEHDPWPLQAGALLDLDDELVPASGVRTAGGPLRALYSPSMRTRFGKPIVVAGGSVSQ
jgi:uncharacterized protein YqjF (DUF2071 family)